MRKYLLLLISTLFSTLCTFASEGTDSTKMSPEQIQYSKLFDNTKVIFTPGSAQQSSSPSRLDSIRSMIELFYVDQYRHFQDPLSPYFLFMSKDATLAMGIGGVVRMRGWYDFGGSIPANGFIPYLIPVPADPAQRRGLDATPAGTALYFRIIGRNKTMGNYQAYIECNFNGYQQTDFHLKKAYIAFNDWTIGYASTSFSDPATLAPTIDGAGANGSVSRTSVLVRWFHNIKKNWAVAASAEFPKSSVDTDEVMTKSIKDWLPDVVVLGQYQWDEGQQHIRLSGMARFLPYRDLVAQKNRTVLGWGAQLSTTVSPLYGLRLYAQVNGGQGYASYTGDLSIGKYDLVGDPHTPGQMYAPYSLGVNCGLKYNFRPNVYAALTLGEMRYFKNKYVAPDMYKYGLYGAVNCFVELTPRLLVGAEYLIGKRMNFNGDHASANRVDALVQFSF